MSNGMEGPKMDKPELEAAKKRLAETIARALKKSPQAPLTLEQMFGRDAARMRREAEIRDAADRRRLPDY